MKPTDFAYHITGYLSKHLPGRNGISSNTIKSYRDTFTLLLRFCVEVRAVPIEKVTLNALDRDLVFEFLDWLETQRGCSVSTRNQRLAAIHAFFRYLQAEAPELIYMCQQVLAVPMKKTAAKAIYYLTLDAVKALLEVPDTTRATGRRDLVMLSLLYDTGARVQEVADLVPADIRLDSPSTIRVTGKGNKSRLVPLMTPTAKLLDQYLSEHNMKAAACRTHPLFPNRAGDKLTRAGITYILGKCVDEARLRHPELLPEGISPHSLRHSKAMHLLQAGVNLVYIRDLLGHVSIRTTEIYARADSQAKRNALEKAYHTVSPSEMPVWQQDRGLLKWLQDLGR